MTNTKAGRPSDEALAQIAEDQARSLCPKCGEGTVPAGELAQWREEAERLLHVISTAVGKQTVSAMDFIALDDHLAAMPQPDVNAELLGALKAYQNCWAEPPPTAEYAIDARALNAAYENATALLERIAQAEKGAA